MNIDPKLGRPDRIVSLVAGVAMIVWGFVGADRPVVQFSVMVLGVVFAVGGLGGT